MTYTVDASQEKAAKVAGLACLISMAIIVFANYAIYGQFVVPL